MMVSARALKGRVMLQSLFISELILRGAMHEIKEVIDKLREMGMRTFDLALFEFHEADAT